jgi:hypothetical protein
MESSVELSFQEKETFQMNISRTLLVVFVVLGLFLAACASTPVMCGSFLCLQQSDPLLRGSIPVVSQQPKIFVTEAPSPKPGGFQGATPQPTRPLGIQQVTQLPKLSPTPMPTISKVRTIDDVVGKRVTKLKNGVIVIPDGTTEEVDALIRYAKDLGQKTMIEIRPGNFTVHLIEHLPKDGNWLLIGVDEKAAYSSVSQQEGSVRSGSTIIYIQMDALKLTSLKEKVDRTLVLSPDPRSQWQNIVNIATTILMPGGREEILLDPTFPLGLLEWGPRAMATCIGKITCIIEAEGGFVSVEEKTVGELKKKYGENGTMAFAAMRDTDTLHLITFSKAKLPATAMPLPTVSSVETEPETLADIIQGNGGKVSNTGVISFPKGNETILKKLVTLAKTKKQEIVFCLGCGQFQESMIHLVQDKPALVIGIDLVKLTDGFEKVPQESTVVFLQMNADTIEHTSRIADRTYVIAPDPHSKYWILVDLATRLLKKTGIGRVFLEPTFANAQLNTMEQSINDIESEVRSAGGKPTTGYKPVKELRSLLGIKDGGFDATMLFVGLENGDKLPLVTIDNP